jgi:hypothetical protein
MKKNTNKKMRNGNGIAPISEIDFALSLLKEMLEKDPKNLGLLQIESMFNSWKKRPAVDVPEEKERASLFSTIVHGIMSGTTRAIFDKITFGTLFQD